MKILMLLESEFPPDVRVENEISTLTEAGHEVHLACTTRKNLPVADRWGKAIIRRKPIRTFVYKSSVGALRLPFYFNFWRKYISGLFEKENYDAIHVHDLPLSKIGAEIKNKYKIPLIMDLHENYPGLLSISPHTNTVLGKLLCNIKEWEKYEKKYTAYADKIIVVVQEAMERIIKLSVPEQKISIVSNTLNVRGFVMPPVNGRKISGRKIFIYEGAVSYHRGIQYVLKALSKIKPLPADIEFWIIGSGSYLKDLKLLVHEMHLGHIVRFFGQQPQEKVFELLSKADYAVIPHIKSSHSDATIPHKLFHYMYAGIPILASNCNPVERIIKETSCGYIYQYDNVDELAGIIELIINGKLFQNSTEGKEWVDRKYNWSIEEKHLIRIYKDLNSDHSSL